MAKDTKKELRNKVIYCIYVRNYSEQGTFRAVEEDLDRICALGVDILWFLPIHPVGKMARKGTLGSPYAIRDYREVNPELGSVYNFESLVNAAHARGLKCILDVVYNHTSPDSWLAQDHPEYFYRTPSGQMGNRIGDWSDIVDLDYGNPDLWDYQIETLRIWAKIVDGFRCDVAPLLPLDFWLCARNEVAKVNPDCLWLSESVEPSFIMDLRQRGMIALSDSEIYQAFDICYDYDIFNFFKGYLRGENRLSAYAEHINMQEYIYPDNYVKMRYLENHDQARAKELIPDENALLNWTAFIYFQKGITLLYAGQETENVSRPSLFDKDPVNWNTGKDISPLLRKLADIKKLPLLTNSRYHVVADDENDVLVGTHAAGNEKLIGIFSCKGKNAAVKVDLADGIYRNMIDENHVEVKNGTLQSQGSPIILKA